MSGELILHPIGVIRTPFTDKYSAPRQPGADGEFPVGRVVLNGGQNFEQALADLDGFEKIWLIYHFDRNLHWKPQVLPPRSKVKRGVFATRSPHRPNALGLSLVTLLGIRGRTLTVEGVDMLDKTPLFDIKPYLPNIESFPDAQTGWVSAETSTTRSERGINFTEPCSQTLAKLPSKERRAIISHTQKMLRFDIEAHPYKRISLESDGNYVLAYKQWRITFAVRSDGSVDVLQLFSETS